MIPERVIVLGAGAIGASVGAMLFEVGVPCVLVARRALEQGVELRLPDGARRVPVPCVTSLAPTLADLVLLATMGHHTASAIEGLSPEVPVASFQNGLLPPALLARRGHRTLAAMIWMPAERRGPGQIALYAPGVFLLGRWPSGEDPWAGWLARRLQEAGQQASVETEIAPWVRAKLLVNLGGIVAALCDEPPQDIVLAAQQEAMAVWRASGEPYVEVERLLQRVGPPPERAVDGRRRMGGSTRAALARGEPLETEALHNPIVQAGRACGVPTPVNEALVALSREAGAPGYLSADALRKRCRR